MTLEETRAAIRRTVEEHRIGGIPEDLMESIFRRNTGTVKFQYFNGREVTKHVYVKMTEVQKGGYWKIKVWEPGDDGIASTKSYVLSAIIPEEVAQKVAEDIADIQSVVVAEEGSLL